MVKVDVSSSGMEAILSQRPVIDDKLHPCAFFSRRLLATEWNYEVGSKELLAIKVALEQWSHWLEGSERPIIIWTDHKNLKYVTTNIPLRCIVGQLSGPLRNR